MKKKIGIVHAQWGWGGSEGVALWMLEALKQEYDLTLITSAPVDIQKRDQTWD